MSGKIELTQDKHFPSGSIAFFSEPRKMIGTSACVKVLCGKCQQIRYCQFTPINRSLSGYCRICTNREIAKAHTGPNSHYWKSGKSYDIDGYLYLHREHLTPEEKILFSSMIDHRGYIFEHRVIMARHLCRALTEVEVVHHLNGIKDDNRLENLLLHDSNATHKSEELKIVAAYRAEILRLQNEVTRLNTLLAER